MRLVRSYFEYTTIYVGVSMAGGEVGRNICGEFLAGWKEAGFGEGGAEGEPGGAEGFKKKEDGGRKIHKSPLDKAARLDRIVRKGTKRSQAET
jgi:hypothetical protein